VAGIKLAATDGQTRLEDGIKSLAKKQKKLIRFAVTSRVARDRSYDFKYFRQKISKIIGFLTQNKAKIMQKN
jgi:hypothetical protein